MDRGPAATWLLRGSFVPPTPVRELWDLTRYRVALAQECNHFPRGAGHGQGSLYFE